MKGWRWGGVCRGDIIGVPRQIGTKMHSWVIFILCPLVFISLER